MRVINKKNVKWIFFKLFSNLSFAIVILLLILVFSLLGSIIEQNQSFAYYQEIYPVKSISLLDFNWKFIIALGLDHIYESWWFITILIILSLSLITCTFSVQLPSLRNARRWKFRNNNNNTSYKPDLLNKNVMLKKSIVNMSYSLNSQGYYCFNRHNKIYAYKGLVGRIAPIIVHISLIVILFGSTISFTNGFIVQEMIPVGEIFHTKNILGAGLNSIVPVYSTFRVDNFYINYNFDNSIKQFFSKLSYVKIDGSKRLFQSIFVNSPLKLKNLTFYQTDWQINALRIQIDRNFIIQYKLNKVQIGNSIFWMCNFPVDHEHHLFIVISTLNNSIYIYDNLGRFISVASLNQKVYFKQSCFRIIEIMSSTGLQIKVDPGLPFVYTGFFLLMISTVISYLSYSQLWFNIDSNSCYLNGCTNRAILFFEEELQVICRKYLQNCLN